MTVDIGSRSTLNSDPASGWDVLTIPNPLYEPGGADDHAYGTHAFIADSGTLSPGGATLVSSVSEFADAMELSTTVRGSRQQSANELYYDVPVSHQPIVTVKQEMLAFSIIFCSLRKSNLQIFLCSIDFLYISSGIKCINIFYAKFYDRRKHKLCPHRFPVLQSCN